MSVLVTLAACSEARSSPDAAVTVDAAAVDAAERCPLAINEVAPAGFPNDWFEVVNISAAPVDLGGFRFIDEANDPTTTAPLPPTVLAPGARHVQEVSDAQNGFGLGAGDALYLYRTGATVPCDSADWASGDAPDGSSWARVPDGTGPFATATPDTRGVPN
ncbi:MAG: lamin tail domain-containing protein [Myxococcales bacterium]|nr:lamin tail domain-containing protein [Myxococcales bacterium]